MSISSNSVLHYTNSLAAIKSILQEKSFRLKYCNEKIDIINGSTKSLFDIAIPMVSFCDIPFKEIKMHINEYGSYGIGLSKKWAQSRGLNPVIYLEKNSRLTGIMDSIYYLSNKLKNETGQENEDHINHYHKNIDKYTRSMLGYIKNYCGDIEIKKKNKIIKDYIFYNEREWRFVARDDQDLEKLLEGSEYRDHKIKYNRKAAKNCLDFKYQDVTYIILARKSEVAPFIKFMQENTTFKITSLCTRIITIEQIESDF